MSEEQKALIDLKPGDRTWIGGYRVTRLDHGGWSFWSRKTQRITVRETLPEAVELAQHCAGRQAA
jgi:hypothetical protein